MQPQWPLLNFFIGAVALFNATAPAQEPTRFRIEISVESTLDLAIMGLPKQTTEQRVAGFLSISTRDSAAGTAISALIDSVTVELGSVPEPDRLAAEASQVVISTYRTREGKFLNTRFSRTNPFATLMEAAITDLFPTTTSDPGSSWVDTMNVVGGDEPGSLSRYQVTRYFHRGNSSFLGIEALRLDIEFDLEVSGRVATEVGSAAISGKGSGVGNYYLKAGESIPLGASRTTTQRSQLSLDGLPKPIPVESRTTMIATRIR